MLWSLFPKLHPVIRTRVYLIRHFAGNNREEAYGWWIASLIFMYAWFGLYFLCAHRLFKRNKVPRKDYFKLQMINVSIVIILLRMGFGISSAEYHFIVTRFQYLFGGV